jgi:hypothetical protein
MKKWFFLSLVGALLVNCSNGQQSPRVSAEGKDVKVSYGQPSKRDRVIFGKLVPYGQVWRTGANEATEISFAKDTKFGGKAIKAGTYSLFTIPSENEWTVILNSELKQWGSYDYEKIKAKNVVEVTAPVKKLDKAVEKLTLRFEGGNLIIEWDTTQVQVKLG